MNLIENLLLSTSASDQARILAILVSALAIVVSAIIAIAVVILNQYFLTNRAKKSRMLEKIECLTLVSAQYTQDCLSLLTWVNNNKMERQSGLPTALNHAIEDSVNKMQMICCLYFRKQGFDVQDYYMYKIPVVEALRRGKEIPDEGFWQEIMDDSHKHVQVNRCKLHKLCQDLMKMHGH